MTRNAPSPDMVQLFLEGPQAFSCDVVERPFIDVFEERSRGGVHTEFQVLARRMFVLVKGDWTKMGV